MKAKVGFHGQLGIRVIRANPTPWLRFTDAIAAILRRFNA